MFAVIKTGGKQYKVAAKDKITVMSLEGEAGAEITFSEVLALFDGEAHHVGAPHVEGASVTGEIVEQTRGPKVYAFKKRRRKNSKRKHGHKQDLTIVRILEIVGADGRRSVRTEHAETAAVAEEPQAAVAHEAEAPQEASAE
jgi:large subunit ribosomal protein L21